MCCSIYVNGICLNAWDLVKIEVGLLVWVFFSPGACVADSPGCAGVVGGGGQPVAEVLSGAPGTEGSSTSFPSSSSRSSTLTAPRILVLLAEFPGT